MVTGLTPSSLASCATDVSRFDMAACARRTWAFVSANQGEIRDRTAEGQHYRMAGLNLLAAIIIYWNTKHLGQAVAARRRAGLDCQPEFLAHISPLGWAHILLTGEYRWRKAFTAG